LSIASVDVILPSRYGWRASFWTRSKTGPMMKNVRKSERPTMIWLEGAFGTPRAVRTKPRTITIRVKLVISSTIDGATESSVITMTIWTATLICAGRLGALEADVQAQGVGAATGVAAAPAAAGVVVPPGAQRNPAGAGRTPAPPGAGAPDQREKEPRISWGSVSGAVEGASRSIRPGQTPSRNFRPS
jgi:hypothetical protein